MTVFSRLLVGAALSAALVLAAGAGAAPLANIAPNPSFTADCGAGQPPCGWETTNSGSGGAGNRVISIVTRDTSTSATGPASMKVDTGPYYDQGAHTSSCLTLGLAQGTWSIGYSYQVTDNPDVDWLTGAVSFYSDAACTNGNVVDFVTNTVDPAGNFPAGWQTAAPVSDSITGSFQSYRIQLTVRPSTPCNESTTCRSVANFDDVIVTSPTATAVRVTSLAGSRSTAGVNLTWRAPSTVSTLGFNVWRSDARGVQFKKLNRSLVLGRGAAYRYVDRTALPGRAYLYKLQLVRPDGSRLWAASVRVGAARS